MSLGLAPGTVRLERDHSRWSRDFDQARAGILRSGIESVLVEHIGSTAVAGLAAKPIVDILVAVDPKRVASQILSLRTLGYRYRGFREEAGGHILDLLVCGRVTRHIHVVASESVQWDAYLRFRDYLKRNEEALLRYEMAKMRLALHYPRERRRYRNEKASIVSSLLAEAMMEVTSCSAV